MNELGVDILHTIDDILTTYSVLSIDFDIDSYDMISFLTKHTDNYEYVPNHESFEVKPFSFIALAVAATSLPAPFSLLQVKADPSSLTTASLIKKSGLITQLCKMALPGDKSPEHQLAQSHIAIIRAGSSLRLAINALESLGDVEQRARKDKQKSKLSGLLASHTAFCDLVTKLEEAKNASDDLHATADVSSWDQETKDAASWMWDAHHIDSPSPFHIYVENFTVYDTVSRHLVILTEALFQHDSKVKKVMSGITGEKSWKNTVTADTELEDVIKASAGILKLDLRGVIRNSNFNQNNFHSINWV